MPARSKNKGRYHPENPKKYKGDINKIVWRSLWELEFCKFCDRNENVLMWVSEDIKIPYYSPVDHKWHNYHPDFLVKMKKKTGQVTTTLIEIKPYKETIRPTRKKKGPPSKRMIQEHATFMINSAKWRAAKEWCADRKIDFTIITENELFKDKKK